MRFDLVDLRLFAASVESGSITRGAEAVHLALASASARIAGMEAAMGVPLLQRGRRGVAPTAAGRALYNHAKAITIQIEAMRGAGSTVTLDPSRSDAFSKAPLQVCRVKHLRHDLNV